MKISSKRPEPPTPIYVEEETGLADCSATLNEEADTQAAMCSAAERAPRPPPLPPRLSGSLKSKRPSRNVGNSRNSADNLLIDLTSDGNGPRYITSPKPAQPLNSSIRDIFDDEEDYKSSQKFLPIKPTSQYLAIDASPSLPMISSSSYNDMTTLDLERRREELEQAIATIKYRIFQLRLRHSMQTSFRSGDVRQADTRTFKLEI